MATPVARTASASHELKERYLAPAIRGEMVAAIAVTEPDAGSDVAGLRTRAVRDGDEWVINGIEALHHQRHPGRLAVPAGPHVRRGRLPGHEPDRRAHRHARASPSAASSTSSGNRSSDTAELSFVDVRVPVANTIGEIGRGFQQQMAAVPERAA